MCFTAGEGGRPAGAGRGDPFEETINVPDLDEKDYVSVSWQLDDPEHGDDPFPQAGNQGDCNAGGKGREPV